MPKELDQLVNAVQLLDIWLTKGNCLCRAFPPGIDFTKIEISTDYKLEFSFKPDAQILMCFIACKASGNTENEECFYFDNQFVLVYKLEEGKDKISDKALRDFVNTTALFNAYPYHREQVQGQSIKMGLPAVIIPLLKSIPTEKKKAQKKLKR